MLEAKLGVGGVNYATFDGSDSHLASDDVFDRALPSVDDDSLTLATARRLTSDWALAFECLVRLYDARSPEVATAVCENIITFFFHC